MSYSQNDDRLPEVQVNNSVGELRHGRASHVEVIRYLSCSRSGIRPASDRLNRQTDGFKKREP